MAPPPPTPLRAAILAAGFIESEYFLDLNAALEDPAPRYPRSRMFRWPVSVGRFEDRLTVCHHLMAFEPFVQRVMATLGVAVEIEPHPPGCHGSYHHGVDLASDAGFLDLIKTAHLVEHPVIMRAIVIGTMGGRLSTANARTIVGEVLDAPEPEDQSAANLTHSSGLFMPAFIDNNAGTSKPKTGKGRWAVNLVGRRDPAGAMWSAIHGIENGHFQRDKIGYHHFSDAGIAHFMGMPR
jgi:hypothetical protein